MVTGTLGRARRVTDPLDDRARARLISGYDQLSYVSSGSEHSAVDVDDDDSPCLSDLVQGFLEEAAENDSSSQTGHDSDSEPAGSIPDLAGSFADIVFILDSGCNLLSAQVNKAAAAFSYLRNQKPAFRREMMSFLRELGHNAGICKTRWDSSGGLTGGTHEFIDVFLLPGTAWPKRYIVDLEFASQFEIARPTPEYQRLMESLPRVFVGRIEDLKRIVRAVSDAARRSLKSRDLSLPPWRKNRYMLNKWLGPYRRTINPMPSSSFPSVIGGSFSGGGHCRVVGFDDGVGCRPVVRT